MPRHRIHISSHGKIHISSHGRVMHKAAGSLKRVHMIEHHIPEERQMHALKSALGSLNVHRSRNKRISF